MAKRKIRKKIYKYECNLTGEVYKTTREAASPEELMSVKAYYELHAEEDDRPDKIKKEFKEEG